MNVLIVGGGYEYAALFEKYGHAVVKDLADADLLCFTGGADVSPSYYGDQKHPYTGNDPARDKREAEVFGLAAGMGLPMVGICRGGQFLNVMSGGRMYQHVDEHCRSHFITDLESGEQVYASSTHHQMMMPSSDAVLVASSALHGQREWFDGQIARRDVADVDNEVLFYPGTKCLCFQPHPEFNHEAYESLQVYFFACIDKYLTE